MSGRTACEAANTTYVVTDERVLIQSGVFRPRLTVLDLSDLPPLELDDGGNGFGTITHRSLDQPAPASAGLAGDGDVRAAIGLRVDSGGREGLRAAA